LQLDEQLIVELRSLVEQIGIVQPTPAKKFLYEMIFGLCAVLLVGIAYGFVCRMGSKGKRLVKKLINLARRLLPPKKVIAYAIRKGLAALWAAGLQ
jgi:hypothetical protein